MNNKIFIIVVIVFIAGLSFFLYNNRVNNPTASLSPSPTLTPTPSPVPRTIVSPTPSARVTSTVMPTPTKTPTPTPVIHAVNIQGFVFVSSALTIKKGDTVVWTNKDSDLHTVTADAGLFASGTLNQNGTFSFTFNTTGTFNYHCALHPSMTGIITVTQ